ncbi:hypothetical protein AYI70_g6745 [Smittium culicis]|uniref:Uncharacterized protein n=1 Tax=Smittium culicis TaxID=133412 RepID=A0A1R1XNL4_9FUNG|nr:hypothetical protein AYI70_g6745 [Smittium culicis]
MNSNKSNQTRNRVSKFLESKFKRSTQSLKTYKESSSPASEKQPVKRARTLFSDAVEGDDPQYAKTQN